MRKLKRLISILEQTIYEASYENGFFSSFAFIFFSLFLAINLDDFVFKIIQFLCFIVHLSFFIIFILVPNWIKCAYEYDINLLKEII